MSFPYRPCQLSVAVMFQLELVLRHAAPEWKDFSNG